MLSRNRAGARRRAKTTSERVNRARFSALPSEARFSRLCGPRAGRPLSFWPLSLPRRPLGRAIAELRAAGKGENDETVTERSALARESRCSLLAPLSLSAFRRLAIISMCAETSLATVCTASSCVTPDRRTRNNKYRKGLGQLTNSCRHSSDVFCCCQFSSFWLSTSQMFIDGNRQINPLIFCIHWFIQFFFK